MLIVKYAAVFLALLVLLFGGLYFLLYAQVIKQADLALAENKNTLAILFTNHGARSFDEQANSGGQAYILRLVDENGKELFATQPNLSGLDLSQGELKQLVATIETIYNTVRIDGYDYPWRVGNFYLGPNTVVQIGQNLEAACQFLVLAIKVLLIGLAGSFILVLLLSILLTTRLFKQINAIKVVVETANVGITH